MKSEIIQSAACFCVMMVCVLMMAHAAANGEAGWALNFAAVGFVAALTMGWHIAAAVKAAECPRRPRRRTADEWQGFISQLFKQD